MRKAFELMQRVQSAQSMPIAFWLPGSCWLPLLKLHLSALNRENLGDLSFSYDKMLSQGPPRNTGPDLDGTAWDGLQGSGYLSQGCRSIFSTIENLKVLLSSDGHEHYTHKEHVEHGKDGCSLCATFSLSVYWGKDSTEDVPLRLRDVLQDGWNDAALDWDIDYSMDIMSIESITTVNADIGGLRILVYSLPGKLVSL